MDFCLIGTGVGASMNARAIKNIRNSKITAVCGSSKEHTISFAKKYGIPQVYHGVRDMLKTEKNKAVIIASIPSRHCEDIMLCAKYAQVIVVEKPILIRVEKIDQIKELVEKKDLSISVVYQHRYDYSYQKLNDIIKDIKKDLLYIDVQISDYRGSGYYDGQGQWRKNYSSSGGGTLMQQGIHWLNFLFSLFDYNYSIINVDKFYQPGIETESAITANFLLDKEIPCNVFISRMSAGQKNSINIYGRKNSYFISQNSFKRLGIKDRRRALVVLSRIFNKFPYSLKFSVNRHIGTHKDFLIDVIDKNKNGRRESLYLDDALNDVKLINSIYEFK